MQRRGYLMKAMIALIGLLLMAGSGLGATTGAAATGTPLGPGGTAGLAGSSPLHLGQLTLHGQTRPALSGSASNSGGLSTPHRSLADVHKPGPGAKDTTAGAVPFPTVSCTPLGPGCDAISSSSGGATTNPYGLAATANGQLFHEDIEPPDQGMCAGNGYVMELENIGEVRVFNSTLQPVSGITTLDSLMGLTPLGWSSGGDVTCLYDPDNGGHWFVAEIVSTTSEASGGPFSGCFAGKQDTCREGLAVSTTDNPLSTSWNIYFLDPNTFSPNDPGAGFFLNDFGKIGNTQDALLFFYDEFNLSGTYPPCPAASCLAFNGAQEFAIDKNALESGSATANLVHENMGTDPSLQPPDGNCDSGPTAGTTCWAAIIPASSIAGQFDNSNDGTGFMAGTLDFNSFATETGSGDNRVAVFDWTGLKNLDSHDCATCTKISFGGQLFTGVESYTDDGIGCLVSSGTPCGMAPQRLGTIDLGTYCGALGLASIKKCPEEGIATNGDFATEASYAEGQIWFGTDTLIDETFGRSSEIHAGAAYWVVGTGSFTGGSGLTASGLTMTGEGYVAAAHEDLEYPTLVGGDTAADGAVMSFTLEGNGGPTHADRGGFFPSSAYGRVTATSGGLVASTVNITALGLAPQDGFTEYLGLPGPIRPRWGDYGAVAFMPGTGFYFASEYIQYPNCAPGYWFHVDPTCGGTRDPFANFGTSLNLVS